MLFPGNPSSNPQTPICDHIADPKSKRNRFSIQKNSALLVAMVFISGCVHSSRVSDPYPSGSPIVTTEPAGPKLIPVVDYNGNQATIKVTRENWCIAKMTTPMSRDEYETWNKTPLLVSTAVGSAALLGFGLSMTHSCGGVDATDDRCNTADKVRESIDDDASANTLMTTGIVLGAAGLGLLFVPTESKTTKAVKSSTSTSERKLCSSEPAAGVTIEFEHIFEGSGARRTTDRNGKVNITMGELASSAELLNKDSISFNVNAMDGSIFLAAEGSIDLTRMPDFLALGVRKKIEALKTLTPTLRDELRKNQNIVEIDGPKVKTCGTELTQFEQKVAGARQRVGIELSQACRVFLLSQESTPKQGKTFSFPTLSDREKELSPRDVIQAFYQALSESGASEMEASSAAVTNIYAEKSALAVRLSDLNQRNASLPRPLVIPRTGQYGDWVVRKEHDAFEGQHQWIAETKGASEAESIRVFCTQRQMVQIALPKSEEHLFDWDFEDKGQVSEFLAEESREDLAATLAFMSGDLNSAAKVFGKAFLNSIREGSGIFVCNRRGIGIRRGSAIKLTVDENHDSVFHDLVQYHDGALHLNEGCKEVSLALAKVFNRPGKKLFLRRSGRRPKLSRIDSEFSFKGGYDAVSSLRGVCIFPDE